MPADRDTFLNVPFIEKDAAKALGARFHGGRKAWYVPAGLELTPFARWLSDHVDSALEDPPSKEDSKNGISLSDYLNRINQALQKALPGRLWVHAEIVDLNRRNGHIYLELIEQDKQGREVAKARGIIWASKAEEIERKFAQATQSQGLSRGLKVLLAIAVNFHTRFGLSLIVEDIDPSYTLGDMEAKIQAIRDQLIKEKLYTLNKSLATPADFTRLAIISPPQAAGLGDFQSSAAILKQYALCAFDYFHSPFQGTDIADGLVAQIERVIQKHQSTAYDAIIIIRGGGAKTDLYYLNEYKIAAAVCRCPLPAFTGIGHERDNTILDEVAHTRVDTPSKVIAFVQHTIFTQAHQANTNWRSINHEAWRAFNIFHHQTTLSYQTIAANAKNAVSQKRQISTQHYHRISTQALANAQQMQRVLDQQHHQITSRCQQAINLFQQRTQHLQQQINALAVRQCSVIAQQAQQLQQQIQLCAQQTLREAKLKIAAVYKDVVYAGPKQVLKQGYALVRGEDGRPLSSRQHAAQQHKLDLEFHDGHLTVRTEKAQQE